MWSKCFIYGALMLIVVASAVLGQTAPKRPDKPKIPDEYVRVEVRGTLQTGVAAIGGETTGTEIKVRDMTFELDLGQNPKLKSAAEELNGKSALVRGLLERKKGVERGDRWTITVNDLRPGDAATKKPARAKEKTGAENKGESERVKP